MILSNHHLLASKFDPIDQLKLLREKCNNISSYLYKVHASYLEEIRNVLPQAIRSSIFSIITDQIKYDAGFSTPKSRKSFQIKIDKLVSNNISTLTIEHLNELAKTIDEENKRQVNQAKEEMARALKIRNDSEKSSKLSGSGSINLSSLPPLENLSIIDGWNGELQTPYSIDNPNYFVKSSQDPPALSEDANPNDLPPLLGEEEKMDTFNLKGKEIELLQSIFALSEDSHLNEVDSNNQDPYEDSNSYLDLKNNRLLPETPIGLYEWMISIDVALIRSLRDLSHAINGELLRSGLVNTLVPLNILDAALAGQLVSTKSISNILTLKLPTNSSLGAGGLDIDCLLITSSDLEFDNPRLRRNRTNLKHYQNELLGMIKQQRYWQARSLEEEVSKEWWKDTTKI